MSLHDISRQIAELTRRLTVLEANRSSRESDRTPTYTSNVTSAPTGTHSSLSLPGRDSVRQPNETESSLTDTHGVAESSKVATPSPNYIYYRIYAEDGAIPSKTHDAPCDPFLGRIKIRSVPPPRTAKSVKYSIGKVENIKDRVSTSLFLTPYSESPMDDADKITILNGTGPGSTPQKPLALVAKMSDSDRSALESDGRGGLGLANAKEPESTPLEIRNVYYLLYADGYEVPSKAAYDPEEPSLGRIWADCVAPPHCPASIKRCISRVEKNPALAQRHTDLFADTSCDTPLKEGHISFLRTDGPGLSPNEPMAIVQVLSPHTHATPIIPHGRYVIRNRAANIYWNAAGLYNSISTVYFYHCTLEVAMNSSSISLKWDITHDTNGNIIMTSPSTPSSWVGAEITRSTVPVPWRLIPAENKSYYLTTDMNFSQNPRVPAAAQGKPEGSSSYYGSMATLKEGDEWQMWEFVRISTKAS